MTQHISKHEKTLSALIHASTFSKYVVPFGNLVVPLILWLANKENSKYTDFNGKEALNFQISILLYGVILASISVFLILVFAFDFIGFINVVEVNKHDFMASWNRNPGFGLPMLFMAIAISLGVFLFLLDVLCTIKATLSANSGERYTYPLTINFIGS